MNELLVITNNFQIFGVVDEITTFGEGFINSTYKVSLKNSKVEYVLQKINHSIFGRTRRRPAGRSGRTRAGPGSAGGRRSGAAGRPRRGPGCH